MKNIKPVVLLLSLVLFAVAIIAEKVIKDKEHDFPSMAIAASEELQTLETSSINQIKDLVSKLDQGVLNQNDNTEKLTRPQDHWLSVFIYEKDSAVWWSDNNIFPDKNDLTPGFRFFRNGWYEVLVSETSKHKVVGLLKIKSEYAFQNRFLANDFHPSLNLPASAAISQHPMPGSFAITSNGNTPLFYIQFSETDIISELLPWIAFVYIISYLLFLLSVYNYALKLSRSDIKAGFITLITVVITRLLSIYYVFPESLYGLSLFSPSYYASSFILNSLGDLLISTLLITYLIGVFYKIFGLKIGGYIKYDLIKWQPLSVGFVIFFTFLYSVFINYLLAGLIINSRISFNINNVFELNVYSLVGVLIIGILLFSFYLVCDGGVRMVLRTKMGLRKVVLIFFISQFIFLALLYTFRENEFFREYGVSTFLLTNFLMLYNGYIRKNLKNMFAFTRYLLLLFGFSIYAAQTISDFNKQREKENRRLLAVKLENEQDQTAEYLFDDIAEKVSLDKVITTYFASPYELQLTSVATDDVISRRMTQVYFTGYWGKYDITIKTFNSDGLPVNTGGDPTWNLDFFNILIREDGQPTTSPYLFFTGNVAGKISYIGRIPIKDPENPKKQTGTMVINLSSKSMQDEAGFPELLISDKVPQKKDISNYSYANYKNNLLVNQFGSFSYLVNSSDYLKLLKPGHQEQFVVFEDYSHLFYKGGDESLLIVSIRNPGIMEFITLFSYLFSFYGFSFLIIYGIGKLWRSNGRIEINFKGRIQATVVMIVVVTMVLIGGATVYYIYKSNLSNVNIEVNERLKSMLIAIRDELSNRTLEGEDISDEMNYTFSKLANTLSIDFNIYTRDGMLVYSTQPKIYDQSLKARTMSRRAMDNLVRGNKSLHIQFEQIGTLRYLSAYEPVRNNNNTTIGIINLPYFAKQDELKKDISSFLVALINIYVLLFAFAIFITFIISNRITKPLQLIQERLGKIKLGKRNELIEWDRDDEIGALVKEYNRMVEELSESAALLARSERESAWREMAKQVAHEIKNPLTPMKLSVQHLQRAWREKSPNLDAIMNQVANTMVEQIDSLSNIATEFSNFAKMPKANNERVDLGAILRNVVALYGENDSATITYYEHQPSGYFVLGDKEQLIRVFSNLLKNGIQAIPEDTKGHIHVELKKESGKIICSVKDNGTGIAESEMSRIFTPNFTTKTGGMGLGLAMVKSIIEQAGGTVWFTSKINDGAVFYVSLPVFENSSSQDQS